MKCMRVLVVALAALPLLCTAQWRWVDQNGHTVFSDQPPPPDTPAAKIVKQPFRSRTAEPTAAAASAPAVASVASAPKLVGKDTQLQQKKKEAEAAEEAKKKAHEQEVARVQAENCARARQGKSTYESGIRIVRTNEKGEREFLDDDQRAAEIRRLDQVIATECKGG